MVCVLRMGMRLIFYIVWEFIFEAFVAIDSFGGCLFIAFHLWFCIFAFFCHLLAYGQLHQVGLEHCIYCIPFLCVLIQKSG